MPAVEPNEVVLRFGARAAAAATLEHMARELAGIALAGPAGICGAGGRPGVSPAYGYWPALIPRSRVTARAQVCGAVVEHPCDTGCTTVRPPEAESSGKGERVCVPLWKVAYGRSGDKGDSCNVGIAALCPDLYPELVREVTSERVARHFASNVHGKVVRYRLDNLCALNFLMRGALGGGGTVSLLVDTQGKTAAQGLLMMEVQISEDLLPDPTQGGGHARHRKHRRNRPSDAGAPGRPQRAGHGAHSPIVGDARSVGE